MSDDNKFTGNGRNEKKSSEIRVPSRNWLLWILILGCIPLLMVFKKNKDAAYQPLSRSQLIGLANENIVHEGMIHYNPQSSVLNEITGYCSKSEDKSGVLKEVPGGDIVHFKVKTRLTPDLESALLNKGFDVQEPNTFLLNIFVTILPILFVAFLIYFFFIRQIKMGHRRVSGRKNVHGLP